MGVRWMRWRCDGCEMGVFNVYTCHTLYSVVFAGFSAESLRERINDSECVCLCVCVCI